jgi:hypothetical protein
LYEWIPTLNAIDVALTFIVNKHPSLLLVAPVPRKDAKKEDSKSCHAISIQDVSNVPEEATQAICTLLRFLSQLLRNATNKSVFNSVDELADLLAAANDTVASLALEVLCNLATPPALHKQQAPEMHQHSTVLHTNKTTTHSRLIALAQGWGTRGSGLGLFACATADDSEYGQGLLPTEAGEINFEFFTDGEEHSLRLTVHDIMEEPQTDDRMEDGTETSKQKRRKMVPSGRGMKTKSTAELFFLCVDQAGGRMPQDRLFPLLSDIRLSRAFHSSEARVFAIENRLRALITILHAHPSQEIMSGYFQAQPELCVELIDLLRPTVSSASVSAAAARPKVDTGLLANDVDTRAIAALANSPQVPYAIRTLAVESLTALVARRDGASGGLTGVARQSNVLSELGVVKGLYLGVLPTLIRYSLASLSTFLANDETRSNLVEKSVMSSMDADAVSTDLGLAFVKATSPVSLPPGEQVRRALEFVDSVLTLASTVVSAPSGTASLTDCGLIPALLSTVAIDSQKTPNILSENSCLDRDSLLHAQSLLRFVTAQSVQIIEGAIVTHNNALSAFHDLQGVDILVSRLSTEIDGIRSASVHSVNSTPETAPMDSGEPDTFANDVEMADAESKTTRRSIHSSQRVLLFSIFNCLSVVFHQESAATAATSPLGGVQLRKAALTDSVKEILDHVDSYGGVLAALIASVLSDVMNSDPQVVHHVHASGLAKSFLRMLTGDNGGSSLPPVPELLMAIPNVLSALSLTEDGATVVIEANPFPTLLSLFHNPEYAMPKSRCLLNEMTAIVGTGMDEIMRHVPRLRPLVINAIVQMMRNVVEIGSKLVEQEEASDEKLQPGELVDASIEQTRTCLMQYAMNFGQMLEQILHSEEHCEPFVTAGGLDAVLSLFPYLMPTGSQFLAHVSALSCPSVCTLTHSSTEDSLTLVFKCVGLHYNPHKLIVRMMEALEAHLDSFEALQCDLRESFSGPANVPYDTERGLDESEHALSAEGVLEYLPRVPLYDAMETEEFRSKAACLSRYLRAVVNLQWLSNLLASVIRAASQSTLEMGTEWGRNDREWKNDISSPRFIKLVSRLSVVYQSSLLEVCRIRTEDGFESRDRKRLKNGPVGESRVRYRLRIVCQEGAVVRNGIEIDSCASVGSMEMGEIVEAFDRCLNSSGIMRYRTQRGWVSELTRGHGRDPIAEVLSIWNAQDEGPPVSQATDHKTSERVNCGIADVCSVSTSILARLQSSYTGLFSSLSRDMVQSFKVLRTMSCERGTVGGHVKSLLHIISSTIQQGFNKETVAKAINNTSKADAVSDSPRGFVTSHAGVSIYLGALLSHLHACLFEEKRDRKIYVLNLPLLISLVMTDRSYFRRTDTGSSSPPPPNSSAVFLKAIIFVFKQSLNDLQSSFSAASEHETCHEATKAPFHFVSRCVAASLPPSIELMQRLISGSLITSSSLTSILGRLSDTDLFLLVANDAVQPGEPVSERQLSFHPDYFAKAMKCSVADTLLEVWQDPRFIYAPAHIVHPFTSLAGELILSLDEASKPSARSSGSGNAAAEGRQWGLFSARSPSLPEDAGDDDDDGNADADAIERSSAEFEPSDEAISQLVDMGFSRAHALDALASIRSNSVDEATDYALGIASPAAQERNRTLRQWVANLDRAGQADGANDSGAAEGEETTQNEAMHDEDMVDNGYENAATEGNDKVDVKLGAVTETETRQDPDELMKQRVKQCLQTWIASAPNVAFDIISGTSSSHSSLADTSRDQQPVTTRRDDGKGQGDAEIEALTVVTSSFVLDLCQRYPDERLWIVSDLFERLKCHFTQVQNGDDTSWTISSAHSCSFASLCHAAVLFTRALPRTRVLVLQNGLVRRLVSTIQTFAMSRGPPSDRASQEAAWPIWLAPSLLLLDVMAQPMTAFLDYAASDEDDDVHSGGEELSQVREEHKLQAAALAKTADAIFNSIRELEQQTKEKVALGDRMNDAPVIGDASDVAAASEATSKEAAAAGDSSPVHRGPFASVPPYFPMLPSDSVNTCMSLCLDLLGKGRTDDTNQSSHPPPGIVQAVLFLLVRLLRSPKVAAQCLLSGTAELILSLPRDCRFNGSAGVITVILRRLLEDEPTLQSAMAVEMRYAITKLIGEKSRHGAQEERPKVSRLSFLQAVTPLFCRDATSFLKAAATTVCIESKEPKGDADNTVVVLLTTEQSALNSRALAKVLSTKDASVVNGTEVCDDKRGTKASNNTKSHRHRRSSSLKRSNSSKKKKEKVEFAGTNGTPLNGTPANHVTCLLIAKVVALASHRPDTTCEVTDGQYGISTSDRLSPYGESNSFLWLADALEIMADLVLAVPTCAAAIHRYRFSCTKERSAKGNASVEVFHALGGCPNPPQTFVNFILHLLLPQDRMSFRRDPQARDLKNDDDDERAKIRKKLVHIRTRVAQTSARLLVSLVARTGEGRRRVIADLTFALSGGHFGHISSSPASSPPYALGPIENEFHALQSWSDLCIGLAAPRSNGVNHDNNSNLSFEVVKLMLDFGMAHALMYGVQRVRLQHPMAASTCASLLGPLEVFTRGSVSDAVQAIADKEVSVKEKRIKQDGVAGDIKTPKRSEVSDLTRSISAGPSQRSEATFADDGMLEDGFDSRSTGRLMADYNEDAGDELVEEEDEDVMSVDDEEDGENSAEDEIEMEEAGESDSEADIDDEEISSDEDSVTSDEDSVTEDIELYSQTGTDEDDDSCVESEEDDDDSDDEAEEFEWDEGNANEFLGGTVDEEANDGGGTLLQGESELDEGWTRIESSGFGGMLVGSRRNGRTAAAANLSARSRGFIDAAEAMIGSLLRSGEIEGSALAEIEGTLGIRIMPHHRGLLFEGPGDGENALRSVGREPRSLTSVRSSTGEAIGSLPRVHQRSPPDSGFSAIGGGLRWNEIDSMEYVYGGPSVAAGDRNYDLTANRPRDPEADPYPTPSQLLFPGGPAAATHSRAQQSLHPLLCGVNLPPVNALVSDLLPHGVRATQRSQAHARRPGDFGPRSFSAGYLVSTSTGNAVRLNRGGPFTESPATRTSAANDLVGWTDDGLPFDSRTVGEFGTAFERALGESMLLPSAHVEEPVASASATDQVTENAGAAPVEPEGADDTIAQLPDSLEEDMGMNPPDPLENLEMHDATSERNEAQPAECRYGMCSDNAPPEGAVALDVPGSPLSDGDGVASSLAAGLQLSSRSDASGASDQCTAAAGISAEEAPQQDPMASEDSACARHANARSPTQDELPGREAEAGSEGAARSDQFDSVPGDNGLTCPPGMDQEVFVCLPIEMQREVVEQARTAAEVAGQLDAASGLDPEALAALPEDMRREVIEQDQRERRLREQAPADPSNAEEMDNASFLASLAPDLRDDILLTADETFLSSLPPNIIAEAQILRERASFQYRSGNDFDPRATNRGDGRPRPSERNARNGPDDNGSGTAAQLRRKQRPGKTRLDCDRDQIVYLPSEGKQLPPLLGLTDLKALLRLMYLRSPVRPQRLLQKVFQNVCTQSVLRNVLATAFVQLLNDDGYGAVAALQSISKEYSKDKDDWRTKVDAEFAESAGGFPPSFLIGAAPEVVDTEDFALNVTSFSRRQTRSTAASSAANLRTSAKGSRDEYLPPVVATLIIDTLFQLSKTSPRICFDALTNGTVGGEFLQRNDTSTCFDRLLDLLEKPRYVASSTNLEQLLNLIENMVSPLALLPKPGDDEQEISQRDIDAAAAAGKEWVDAPRVVVSQSRLELLCSILRMESCRDAAFTKLNSITRRLCRVEANRGYILAELGAVAQSLATDAIRDLKTLNIRMQDAVSLHQNELAKATANSESTPSESKRVFGGPTASSSVTLSISSSELKLLRVLQTLQSLCVHSSQDEGGKRIEGSFVFTDELIEIFQTMKLDDLWSNLDSCLHVVKVLEGVTTVEEMDDKNEAIENDTDDGSDDNGPAGKKLQNSVAGLLTRFLPVIEAFFVVNASGRKSSMPSKDKTDEETPNSTETDGEQGVASSPLQPQQDAASIDDADLDGLIGGKRIVEFVAANRVLLNALIRNNPALLEKGLRVMVQLPRCRALLDFDVKRHWFKTQVRRLRQQASRRHGSLRLSIRRKFVFEDAYHQLRLRNADEMRGRLHITFRNEEGVDAGGLSREFFAILAKEIFNPNYALFTSTEDGCTFQPNQNSSINQDHLSYFRFVGRIVGKAVADGFLLDAHFTRSLYKHMLGQKVNDDCLSTNLFSSKL